MAKSTLTAMRRKFALNYAVDENGAKAARDAGYSPHTAKGQAGKLLKIRAVKTLIKKEKARLLAEREAKQATKDEQKAYTEERIKREWAAIGFSRIDEVCEFNGETLTIKPSSDLSDSTVAAISEVKRTVSKGGHVSMSVKMHPKLPALQAMAQELGMLVERHEITEKKAEIYLQLAAKKLIEKGVDPKILSEVTAEMEEMEND